MSDNATETGKLAPETEATPKPEFSQDPTASSPGQSDEQLDALIEKLSPRLEKVFTEMAQSSKDKGIASAKKDASSALAIATSQREIVETFQNYVKVYGSEAAALREMERDEKINSLGQPASIQEPVSAGPDARPWGVRQKEILESAGLELTDPRAVELAKSQKWTDPEVYLKELATATFGWAQDIQSKPKPDASTAGNLIPGTSSTSSFTKDDDALGQELLDLSVDYSKNSVRIGEINAELKRRDKGSN